MSLQDLISLAGVPGLAAGVKICTSFYNLGQALSLTRWTQ